MSASDPASNPVLIALLALECLLLLGGCAFLVLRVRGLLPRFLGLTPSPLAPSTWRASEVFLAAACSFGGAIILQQVVAVIANRWYPAPVDGSLGFFHVLAGAGFQFGLLAGLGFAFLLRASAPQSADASANPAPGADAKPAPTPARPAGVVLRGGFLTFLAALTVVGPVSLLWQTLLDKLGVDAPPQDLISLFNRSGDLVSLSIMISLAVLVAPVTEELLFRVGLFRWLRTRTPRSAALFVPAIIFAMIHGNLAVLVPLVVLAIILALGYEHYGHPGVPILAHALFNLNTITLLLAGLTP